MASYNPYSTYASHRTTLYYDAYKKNIVYWGECSTDYYKSKWVSKEGIII